MSSTNNDKQIIIQHTYGEPKTTVEITIMFDSKTKTITRGLNGFYNKDRYILYQITVLSGPQGDKAYLYLNYPYNEVNKIELHGEFSFDTYYLSKTIYDNCTIHTTGYDVLN